MQLPRRREVEIGIALACFCLIAGGSGATGKTKPRGANLDQPWAFQPPVRPRVPAVKNRPWIRNPIDAFVLAKLEEAGLTPAPAADRATLIRRLSFDLLGLPPTLEELHAFVEDRSPDAYEKLVDWLLASPHY